MLLSERPLQPQALCSVMLTTSWLRRLNSVRRRKGRAALVERLESRELLAAAVYVDAAWSGLAAGIDPDGSGPATSIGVDAFSDIGAGVANVADLGTVLVRPGTYAETVTVAKPITLQGTSSATSVIIATPSSSAVGISISGAAGDVTLRNLTITGAATGVEASLSGDLLLDTVLTDGSTTLGVNVAAAEDVTISNGRHAGLTVRNANSVSFVGSRIDSTGNVDVETRNQVLVGTTLDAGASTLRFVTNLDGSGGEGFRQLINTTIRTTNDTTSAIRIEANTLLGGSGDVEIGRLITGVTDDPNGGRVTIIARNGAIADSNSDDVNLITNSAILLASGGIGSIGDQIETTMNRLTASGGANGLTLSNSSALTIEELIPNTPGIGASTGDVKITSPRSITVNADVLGRSVYLKSLENNEHVEVRVKSGATVRGVNGSVEISSGDDVAVEAGSIIESLTGGVYLKGDDGNFDFGAGANISVDGLINSFAGARLEGNTDSDLISVSALGVGGLRLDGAGRSDRYVITYPSLPQKFGSTITVQDSDTGNDQVTINGTDGEDVLFFTTIDPPTTVETEQVTRGDLSSERIVLHKSVEALAINTGDGADTVTVQPTFFFPVTVNGGDPCFEDLGSETGDTLVLDPLGNDLSVNGHVVNMVGKDGIYQPVKFLDIENLPLNPVGTGETLKLDFNHTNTASSVQDSPTEPGYIGVRAGTLYSQGLGYGWREAVSSFERNDGFYDGPQTRLVQDGHSLGLQAIFTVDVPTPGYYSVAALMGNPYSDMQDVMIKNGDSSQVLVEHIAATAGQSTNIDFVVFVPDTTLDLRFVNSLSRPALLGLNALVVRPAEILTMGLDSCNASYISDGVTTDHFTVSHAPSNSYVTVSIDLGTLVTPDADPEISEIQVLTDEEGRADIAVRRPFGAGTATIELADVRGTATGVSAIEYALPLARNFDFNHLNRESMSIPSPTMEPVVSSAHPSGYIGVLPTDLYTESRGYGWLKTAGSFDDYANIPDPRSDLHRDGHFGSAANAFMVDLPNDVYDVRLTMGYGKQTDDMSVRANGVMVVSNEDTLPYQYFQTSFRTTVSNGQLLLEFGDGGLLPNWVVNGLEIRSTSMVEPITFTQPIGSVEANGSEVRTIHATSSMAAGGIVTVSSTLGTILTPDLDEHLEGVQVAVGTDGAITFDLRAEHLSGTPRLKIESIDGSHQGEIKSGGYLRFVVDDVRRYDFNHKVGFTETPTEAGFIGVNRFDLDAEHVGFGFVTSPNSTDFSVATPNDAGDLTKISKTSVALYRDAVAGHFTLGSRIFQIEAKPGTAYDIRVFTGHPFHDQATQANAEGVPGSKSVTTQAGFFSSLTFFGARDTNGDGLIDVSFGNAGGISPLWIVTGLDVAESSVGLPTAAPLLHETGDAVPTGPAPTLLTTAQLNAARTVAINAWAATGLTAAELARLQSVTITITNLDAIGALGLAGSRSILIDDNAAGFGWSTGTSAPNSNKFDLLTVIAHELGHILGRSDLDPGLFADDLMSGQLSLGTRHSHLGAIDDFFATAP